MNAFRYYFCASCGAMSVRNFSDTFCPVCRVTMNCKMVEVRGESEMTLTVTETWAPSTEDDDLG
jgi:uncharacterized Zn finger protein (UPF0148 family)